VSARTGPAFRAECAPGPTGHAAIAIRVEGAVQGVGFRPFVYRIARARGVTGWVRNTPRGVEIVAAAAPAALDDFLADLRAGPPPEARVRSIDVRSLDGADAIDLPAAGVFEIRPSGYGGETRAAIIPDLATCPACLAEVFDPADRRYRYPFTNCTHCGPRFTIIESLPYDRPNTTMKRFEMCEACRAEYEDPGDRRFHAQPNACPDCGPRLALHDAGGATLAAGDAALLAAAAAIRDGAIVAVKGLGGYQLVCDARSEAAVAALRGRKHREEKPFALMFPSAEAISAVCEMGEIERALLGSREAPIVLLRRRGDAPRAPLAPGAPAIAPGVAPGNPCLGVMLPTTALHHLLLRELGFPVVATSGNLSDEPIATGEEDAFRRLAGIADRFLTHDRPIARHVDDSVARVVLGVPMLLRRARGYAPFPIALADSGATVLALGGHLKSTVALGLGHDAFVSQHIGDLGTAEAWEAFRRSAADLPRLYAAAPAIIAADAHPDYLSTRHAVEIASERASGTGALPVARIQHHHAHIVACMAEHGLAGPVLGVSWDGTGWGPDNTIWGGEFLIATARGFRRFAHLRSFPIAGGDAAMRQPRRAALGILAELLGAAVMRRDDLPSVLAFTPLELNALVPLLVRRESSPGIARTSSMGRLFDAVASLLDLRQRASFEGQAAMELESAADAARDHASYPLPLREPSRSAPGGPYTLDWAPLIRGILEDLAHLVPAPRIAARFHESLVAAILAVARAAGEHHVVLSGGCFQNARLLEGAVVRLEAAGFAVWRPRQVPPNDGGIALGQLVAARAAGAGS